MADFSYIDKYFNRVVRNMPDEELEAASRAPAGQVSDPNSVLNPLGATMPAPPQREEEIEADLGVINPTPRYDRESIAENFRRNEVSNILGQESVEREMRSRADKAQVAESESRQRAREAVDRLNDSAPEYKDNPTLLASIEDARKKATADTSQPRDFWSEIILSFGPAALGAVTGEAGQIAQLQAGKEARQMYEGRRKESIEAAQKAKEAAQKQYEMLMKLKSEQRESWDKSQQRLLDRVKAIANAEVDFLKADSQRVNEFTKEANKVTSEINKATSEGNKEYSQLAGKSIDDEQKAKRAKIIANGQGFKDATNLRKEFLAQPVVKNFQDVQQSYVRIQDLAKNPSAAGDISMIFSYMKMLDPGSVVREGEQATAQNASGVPDQVRNAYNRVLNGQRLTPKQRQDFTNQARSIYNSQQSLVRSQEKTYQGLASQYGTNPSLVVADPSEPVGPRYKDGDSKVIQGQKFVRKDGRWIPAK